MPEWMSDTFWVAAALLVFLLIAWRMGAFRALTGMLDDRASLIAKDLEEAKRLRSEAQAMLAEAEREKAQAEKTAKEILTRAKKAAEDEAKAASEELEDRIARRAEAAERAIAQAERDAAAEVRARAAELATQAAKDLIIQGLDSAAAKDEALKTSLGQVKAKLN